MSHLSRRDFLKLGTGVVGAAALAPAVLSSGLGGATSAAATRPRSAAPETYDLWTYETPTGGQNTFKQMVAAYNASKGQSLTFNVSAVAGAGAPPYIAKMHSLISAGEEPDVFQDWIGSLAEPFIKAGDVRPLDDWFSKYGWNKILFKDAVELVSYNGRPYGVPWALSLMPFWYSKTLFAKADVAPPKTYAEFEAVNTKLVKAGITPTANGAIDGWDLMRLFEYLLEMTAGPTLHDQLLDLQASWTNPAVADAFALLKKWGDQGWIEKGFLGTQPTDADTLFQAGKAAMDLTGNWEEGQIVTSGAKDSDFSVFVGPTDHQPNRLSSFAQQWMVNRHVTGARLDALGDFFDWFIQRPQSLKYYYGSSTATIGGTPSKYPNGIAIINIAQTHETFTVMDEKLSPQAINGYNALADEVCRGSMSPKSAAAQMEKVVRQAGG